MATQTWVNIGSSNGLMPDVTRPLPEPVSEGQWVNPSHAAIFQNLFPFLSFFSSAMTQVVKIQNLMEDTLRSRQNGRHFADDISRRIFLNENARISVKISLKFVPKVRINNIPAMVQTMAWHRPGDKPLSEPMMVNLTDAYMRHSASMSEVLCQTQWKLLTLYVWNFSDGKKTTYIYVLCHSSTLTWQRLLKSFLV